MKKMRVIKLSVYVLIFGTGILFIVFSSVTKKGVRDGIDICINTLIPSLFPFLCFSNAAVSIILSLNESKTGNKISSFLFCTSDLGVKVYALSLIGGYPVGPIMTDRLLKSEKISKNEAKRLMLFACNSGPAFTVIAVGEGMAGSKALGVTLLISTTLAGFIIACILGRIKRKKSPCKVNKPYNEKMNFSEILCSSVEKSTAAMVKICAMVIIFNMLTALVTQTGVPAWIKSALYSFSEVTTGCLYNKNNPVMLAAILGFGGFCVFFQIKEYLERAGVKAYEFFTVRTVFAALSALITKALLHFYPLERENVQAVIRISPVKPVYGSIPLSILLFAALAVFILDRKHISLKS